MGCTENDNLYASNVTSLIASNSSLTLNGAAATAYQFETLVIVGSTGGGGFHAAFNEDSTGAIDSFDFVDFGAQFNRRLL